MDSGNNAPMRTGFVWEVSFLPQLQDIEGKAPGEWQTIAVPADSGKQAIAMVETLCAQHRPGAEFQVCGLGLVKTKAAGTLGDPKPLIVWILPVVDVAGVTTEASHELNLGTVGKEVLEPDHGPGRFGIPVPPPLGAGAQPALSVVEKRPPTTNG